MSALAEEGVFERLMHHASQPFLAGSLLMRLAIVFSLGFAVSSIGIGNILGLSILAPLVYQLKSVGIAPLHAFLSLIFGVNAGALSPLSPSGLIASNLIRNLGLNIDPRLLFVGNALLHAFVFGVLMLFVWTTAKRNKPPVQGNQTLGHVDNASMKRKDWFDLAPLVGLSIFVLAFNASLLKSSIVALMIYLLQRRSLNIVYSKLPWNMIFLLTGMTALVSVAVSKGYLNGLESGIKLFDPKFQVLLLFLGCAWISIFASSSAVVMPLSFSLAVSLFNPSQLGLGILLAAFCSHIVDVSPFSTLGAIAIVQELQPNQQRLLRGALLYTAMILAVVAPLLSFCLFLY